MRDFRFTIVHPNPMCEEWYEGIKSYLVTLDYIKNRVVKRNLNGKGILSIKPIK